MIKRLFDIVVAATALLLLSPVLASVAALVAIKMGRHVFFKQQRPGLHEKPFLMLKFRSMLDATNDQGQALADAQRLTKSEERRVGQEGIRTGRSRWWQ